MAAPQKKQKKALIQFLISAAVALFFGVVTIALIYVMATSYISHTQKEKKQLGSKLEEVQEEFERLKAKSKELTAVQVSEVQASKKITAGTIITEDMVSLVQRPEKGSFLDAFRQVADVIGKQAVNDLLPGQTLTRLKVKDANSLSLLPKGTRAITIAVNPVGTVGGQVSAGSFVDILLTMDIEGGDSFARTVLQRVRVISTASTGDTRSASSGRSSRKESAASTQLVTLAVTPREAEVLALAQSKGTFHLTLRGNEDAEMQSLSGVDVGQLILNRETKSNVSELPNLPPEVQRQLDSFIERAPGSFAQSGLSEPGFPQAGSGKRGGFSMEVYKGSNSEVVQFDR